MQLLKNLISFSRVRTSFLICLYIIFGYLVINYEIKITNSFHLSLLFILSALSLVFCYINAACLNDIADVEIDFANNLNGFERPLVANSISKKMVYIITVSSALIALIFACFISIRSLTLISLVLIFNFIYSFKPVRLSYRGGLAIALLPFVYVFVPMYIGKEISGLTTNTNFYILLIASYFLFCSRLILKDFRDIAGDKKFGKKTFLIRHGQRITILFSASLQIMGVLSIAFIDTKYKITICLAALFLAANSIVALFELSKQDDFKLQGPVLAMFGRLQTGILLCFIIYFLLLSSQTKFYILSFSLLGLCLITVITARDIFIKGLQNNDQTK